MLLGMAYVMFTEDDPETRAALRVLIEEGMIDNAATLGPYFLGLLQGISSEHIKEVRGRGLMIAVELHPEAGGARRFTEALKDRGLLAKETHLNTIRLAPPLVITRDEVDWAAEQLAAVL